MEEEIQEEALSSEPGGSIEMVKEEAPAPEAAEAEAEEAPLEYDITSPELLDAMIIAADVLEKVSKGEMTVSEAISIIAQEVEPKVAESVKTSKTRKRKTSTRKKTAKKTGKSRKRKSRQSKSGKSSR